MTRERDIQSRRESIAQQADEADGRLQRPQLIGNALDRTNDRRDRTHRIAVAPVPARLRPRRRCSCMGRSRFLWTLGAVPERPPPATTGLCYQRTRLHFARWLRVGLRIPAPSGVSADVRAGRAMGRRWEHECGAARPARRRTASSLDGGALPPDTDGHPHRQRSAPGLRSHRPHAGHAGILRGPRDLRTAPPPRPGYRGRRLRVRLRHRSLRGLPAEVAPARKRDVPRRRPEPGHGRPRATTPRRLRLPGAGRADRRRSANRRTLWSLRSVRFGG